MTGKMSEAAAQAAELTETITLSKQYYEELKLGGFLLGALKTAGVEQWEGWAVAEKLFAKIVNE